MAAVIDIINQALKDLGVIGDGQTANDEQINGAFVTLNQLLGQWQAESLHVYAQQTVSFVPTGAAGYTIGAGGAIDISRPVRVDAAYLRTGGVDYAIEVMQSPEDYARIASKSESGMPCALLYTPSYPLGSLQLYPQPTGGEVYLVIRTQLPAYLSAADDIAVPPEYALALRYSLAELLSAENQTPLRPDVVALARKARAIIRRNNVRIPLLAMPAGMRDSRSVV